MPIFHHFLIELSVSGNQRMSALIWRHQGMEMQSKVVDLTVNRL